MRSLIWTVILFNVALAQNSTGAWDGTVAFIKAGSSCSLHDVFTSPSYNDVNNTFKHLWDIPELINDTADCFRSPFLDRSVELEMTDFEMVAYNGAGEVLTSFPFYMSGGQTSSSEGNISFIRTGIMLTSPTEADKIRFLAITVQSSEPKGSQFILTADNNFNNLPSSVNMGCYSFPKALLFTHLDETSKVDNSLECILECVTQPNSNFAAIFPMEYQPNMTEFRCVCVISLTVATSINNTAAQCYDNSDCGCTSYTNNSVVVYPSIYSMDEMNAFLFGLMSYSHYAKHSYIAVDEPYMQLSARSIIKQIWITDSPDFTYKLEFNEDQQCGHDEPFNIYGHELRDEKIFNGSILETIEGTPACCLRMNFMTEPATSHLDINLSLLTDTFIKAEYLRIVGHWKNRECTSKERLHNSSTIPDVWVDIVQMNKSIDTSHLVENYLYLPEMSSGVLKIKLPPDSTAYYVLTSIEIMADVEMEVITTIKTNRSCVVIGYGNTFQQTSKKTVTTIVNSTHTSTLPVPTMCTRTISFFVNATHPIGSLTPKVNKMTYVLRGCVLYDFALNASCNGVDITSDVTLISNSSWYWVPHPVRAVTYLRPGGPGLVLYRHADPYIDIRLHDKLVNMEVTRVRITGDIMEARITIGGVAESLHNVSAAILDYEPVNVLGHKIRVDNIVGSSDTHTDYLVMHIEIEICVPDFAITGPSVNHTGNTNTTTLTTPNVPIHTLSISNTTSAGSNTTSAGSNTMSAGSNTTSAGSNTTSAGSTTTPLSTSIQPSSTTPHATNTSVPTPPPTNLTTPVLNNTQPTTNTSPPTSTTTLSMSTTTTTTSTTTPPTSTSTPPTSTTTTTTSTTTAPTSTTNPTKSTTTPPASTTTAPASTTTAPASTTTAPASTTIPPPSTTLPPPSTTIPPASTTTAPASTTTPPPSTTTPPPSTTIPPPSTTIPPASTTTASASTTTAPASTTTAPPSTTIPPPSTTIQPPSTTIPPASTTTAPASTTTPPTLTTTPHTSTTTQLTSTTTTSASTTTPLTPSSDTVSTTTAPPPSGCCLCFSNTVNLTKAEVDNLVAELVQNLTVSKRKTSAFKRTLVSAPDDRTSAKMVGTAGIAMMTFTGGLILAMDYSHIVAVVKFIKHLFV